MLAPLLGFAKLLTTCPLNYLMFMHFFVFESFCLKRYPFTVVLIWLVKEQNKMSVFIIFV